MRLKLVFLASLIAGVIGAGATVTIIVVALGSWKYALAPLSNQHSRLIFLTVFLPPWICAVCSGTFVYRHTANRRKLQTLWTICLTAGIDVLLIKLLTLFYSGPA